MPELDVLVMHLEQHDRWHPLELSHIFSRLVVDGLLEGSLTPERAACHAAKAAHYGRIAEMDQEVKAAGWAAIQALTGETAMEGWRR